MPGTRSLAMVVSAVIVIARPIDAHGGGDAAELAADDGEVDAVVDPDADDECRHD